MKKLLFFLIVVGFVNQAKAQDRKFSTLTTVGITSPILDNGIGFHLGLNPNLRLTGRLSAEGQISYIYNNIDSFFLTGYYGSTNHINLLCGGRFYMNSAENINRFFINLLLGLNYEREDRSDREIREEYRLGFAFGGYYQYKKLNFGLTYDTHHIVLKCGYSF